MIRSLLISCALLTATSAGAVVPIYGSIGTPNNAVPLAYNIFTASSTGSIYAWFMGKNAQYTSVLSLKVNGVTTPYSPIFDNQTTVPGTSALLGMVSAGDTLEFILTVLAPPAVAGNIFSSTPANNADKQNHIFRSAYGGGDFGIPLGSYTYIGFEDIKGKYDGVHGNDWDYDDHRFAFSNIAKFKTVVPEPASWVMMIAGFGLVGGMMRRRAQRAL